MGGRRTPRPPPAKSATRSSALQGGNITAGIAKRLQNKIFLKLSGALRLNMIPQGSPMKNQFSRSALGFLHFLIFLRSMLFIKALTSKNSLEIFFPRFDFKSVHKHQSYVNFQVFLSKTSNKFE